jgi:CDP-glucose 4,6-dehydratase
MFDGVKVLVTGCSGFLGPWICERLIAQGAEVLGGDLQFDAASRVHDLDAKRFSPVAIDVEELEQLEQVINQHGVQFVFHLAAQSLVGTAIKEPVLTIATNVMGTANVLEVARRLQASSKALRGVVIASSDKAYGDQEQLPYVEDAPMMGRFPYDVSKSCADLIARSYAHTYSLPIAVVRCGNLYGAGDMNWSRIVPGTFRRCLTGQRPVIRSDGTPVRDYVYVEDAAEAFVSIGSALMSDDAVYGEAFNVSAGEPLSVLEMVAKIQAVVGGEVLNPLVENSARAEIKAQYLSSERLTGKVGWKPRTTVSTGLERALAWYRKRC